MARHLAGSLAAALLGFFVVTLDAVIVNVALLARRATFPHVMRASLLIAAVALATAAVSLLLRPAADFPPSR